MIREKKFVTLSTEIDPAMTKMVKFGPKKTYFSTGTQKAQNKRALELKHYFYNDDDLWKKIWVSKYPKPLKCYYAIIFRRVFSYEVFYYFDT